MKCTREAHRDLKDDPFPKMSTSIRKEKEVEEMRIKREAKMQRADVYADNKNILYPKPQGKFILSHLEHLEKIKGFRQDPVGKSSLRDELKPEDMKYAGKSFEIGEPLKAIVNPPLNPLQVNEESQIGHQNYVKSHRGYFVGEQCNRNYDWKGRKKEEILFGKVFGRNYGRTDVDRVMHWSFEDPSTQKSLIISNKLNNFQKKFQPQLGKIRDPNESTRKVGPGHRFGIKSKPDKHDMRQLIFNKPTNNLPTEYGKKIGLIAVIREHLKRANYNNFNSLEMAFKNVDREGKGFITKEALKKVCWKFNLPLDENLLEALMRYCCCFNGNFEDFDKETAVLDYNKFVQLLTWPSAYLTANRNCETFGAVANELTSKMGDFNSLMKRENELERRTMPVKHNTTYSEIGVGINHWKKSRSWQTHGLPSVRKDILAPRFKRCSDLTDYGEDGDFVDIMRPSVYIYHGLNYRDLNKLRNKDEMKRLFVETGPQLQSSVFEKVWSLAIKVFSIKDEDEKFSVKGFIQILKKLSNRVAFLKPSEYRVERSFADYKKLSEY